MKRLANLIFYLLVFLLLLLPWHAFIINQFPLSATLEDVVASWKEMVILASVFLAGVLYLASPRVRTAVNRSKILWLIVAFVLINVVFTLIFNNANKAELVGLRTNISFLGVFAAAYVASTLSSNQRYKIVAKIILLSAVAVSVLALIQALFPSWLAKYITNNDYTLQPYLFVQDGGQLRVNSSLWGPSQLASYIVLPLTLGVWFRLRKASLAMTVGIALMTVALYATHSRAAWGAALVSLIVLLGFHYRSQLRRRFLIASSVVVAIGAGLVAVIALKINSPLTSVLFHGNAERALTNSSNSDRFEAISRGLSQWLDMPLGGGIGIAGPASQYSISSLYTESYYVQLLVEVGIIGLATFVAICAAVARRLWKIRLQRPLAVPVLAAFIGLIIVNSVHHTWADAATAVSWWGIAGLLVGANR